MCSSDLSAGAFTTWNAALPFTNSRFMGYTRLGPAVTGFTSMAACIYESQETIWIEVLTNTGVMLACAGALYDPETLTAACGETDGRRYGVVTAGGVLVSNFLGTGATGVLWSQSTSAGGPHGYMWRPGSTTVDTVARVWTTTGAQTATSFTDLANQYAGIPLYMPASSGHVGRIREAYLSRPLLYHQRVESSPGVIAAYGMGWSTSSATGDSLFLKY